MTALVLVTGGTGRLGRHVVRRLRSAGRDIRVLSRRGREKADSVQFFAGDLDTGEGVDAAVAGVAAIVPWASSTQGDAEATRNLVRAESGPPPHLVYISTVGIEAWRRGAIRRPSCMRSGSSPFSGLPWTILRATQFYDYLLNGAQKLAWLPVVPVPAGFRIQPVDADEVAARLVDLALGEPAGRVPDMAGAQVIT